MRKLILFTWLLLPVGTVAYHYGPGQERLRADDAAQAAERAARAVEEAQAVRAAEGDLAAHSFWLEAEQAYSDALAALPAGRAGADRALRLERAKAQMHVSKLADARRELEALVDELVGDPAADRAQLADARHALANAQYYTTWLLRLEGEPRDVWEAEIEAARQNFKQVAEEALAAGDAAGAREHAESLEAALRLARIDLTELQGQPLPCACRGCCSGSRPSRRPSASKGQRPEDARGAGSGPPPDGSGS